MNLNDELKKFCRYLSKSKLYLGDLKELAKQQRQPSLNTVVGYTREYLDQYRGYQAFSLERDFRHNLLSANVDMIAVRIIATVMKLKAKKQ